MERSDTWKECVRVLLQGLKDAPSASAREAGRIWEWAFETLEKHPDDFNRLQDTCPEDQTSLVRQFLETCESRSKGEDTSDLKTVEFAISKSLPLSEAPEASQISDEVADALTAFGTFLGHEGHNTIDSPGKFPYTAALFGFHDQVLSDILESKQIPEGQRAVLKEIAECVPQGTDQREYFRRCEAAAKIERFFGFSKRLLTSTDVYQRGKEFYHTASRLGPGQTLTFSNSSGLWNPLERTGTAEFIRRYGVLSTDNLKYKDGFRATNFTDGILNPDLACKRIYLFNEDNTWKGFRNARACAADKASFDKKANSLIEEVCARMEANYGQLHLVAVKNWHEFPPLNLATRISKEVIMFSNRGSDLAICHAFWCGLTERGRSRTRTVAGVVTVAKALLELASGGVLSVLDSLVPFMEALFGDLEVVVTAEERFVGERMRRLIDNPDPEHILRELEDRFGIKMQYVNPSALRQQLLENIEHT